MGTYDAEEAFLKSQPDNEMCLNLNPWLTKINTNKSPMIGILTQTMSEEE
jgi:hypothetical protein